MRMLFVCLALVLSCILNVSYGSKILGIFPMPCKSHHILGEALLIGLTKRGHDVTMISPFTIDKPVKNYKEVVLTGMVETREKHFKNWSNATFLDKTQRMYTMFHDILNLMHNNSNVREFVNKGEKYDLCIASLILSESLLGICNAVQAPAISFSLVGLNSFVSYHTNNPVPYSYVPSVFASLTDKMSFLERVQNTLTWVAFDGIIKFISLPFQTRLLEKYYPDAPAMDELLNNMDLVLMNSHMSTDAPKALLPNIIPIGGFHLQIMEEIPKDLKNFLDNSKNGVIYFNLGSNMKSSDLDEKVINALVNTFAKLDYDILWKFEKDLTNKPKNLRIEKWLAQRSILSHPNVKIFMTHGGLGSTVESIYGAVPMLCLPLFGDQGKNCAESAKNGYAVVLELGAVTEETLMSAVRELLDTPSYKENILLKSDLYKNQEVNPMDRAIFWAEHVIRHKGAKHLKSQAANIPWYQYYLLDVISSILVVVFSVLAIVYYVSKLNIKLVCWILRNIFVKKQSNVQSHNKKSSQEKKLKKIN